MGKYLENGWSDQHGDFSVEFVIEKLTTLNFKPPSFDEKKNFNPPAPISQFPLPVINDHSLKFNGYTWYMTSIYRDTCVKVTPQSIWIHYIGG